MSASLNEALRAASQRCGDDNAQFAREVASALAGCRDAEQPQSGACLLRLLALLADVNDNARANMMTAENLAICFAPNVLLRNPDDPSMMDLQPSISLMERLVLTAHPIIQHFANTRHDAKAGNHERQPNTTEGSGHT